MFLLVIVMVKHLIVVDIAGLEPRLISEDRTPNICSLSAKGELARVRPVFPAVTCTSQATMLSGTYPRQHGIISNGLYDRQTHTVSFWEQSSSLVQAEKVWDIAKRGGSGRTTAALFWQNTMYADADIVLTPRPLHMEDRMIMWCYSRPPGLYEKISYEIGKFDLSTYWGPLASNKSSAWIGRASELVLERQKPNILFTYIPHLDYIFQREGIFPKNLKEEIRFVDNIVGNIMKKTIDLGIRDQTQFVILSEYGFSDVTSDIPINRVFREHGLLAIREIEGREYIDFEYSLAFAMVDHQVAHIYVKGTSVQQVKRVLDAIEGIDIVLDEEGKKLMNIDHERSGDLIAISDKDRWFSYYWWFEEKKSPPFANRVDIHRKPGYDPSELFIDSKTNRIPLNGKMVKASHGRVPSLSDGAGLAVYVSDRIGINKGKEDIVDTVTIGRYINSLII
jgi:predicted AlkP superfamily pyrophosphatase or phosphodiesterase